MKKLIESLLTSEKEKMKRFSEFIEFLKTILTTIPSSIREQLGEFPANRYMYIPRDEDFKKKDWEIELDSEEELWFWEERKHKIIIKKNGVSKLSEDIRVKLEILDIETKLLLDKED